MLVFRKGTWSDVPMPTYVDPTWLWGDRQKAAAIIHHAMEAGATWDDAWIKAEIAIYESLGVSRKQHDAPKNQEEDGSVEEESQGGRSSTAVGDE